MKLRYFFLISVVLFSSIAGYANTSSFEKSFSSIDSLLNNGLPRQALDMANDIFESALIQNNQQAIISALNERNKCITAFEEEPGETIISLLLRDVARVDEPVLQIIHSMLAGVYWDYYKQNLWKISGRTNLDEANEADIRQWSLTQLTNAILKHADQSLVNAEKLQSIAVDNYSWFVQGDSSLRHLRPTLYDQLVFRVLEILKDSRLGIEKPVDAFQLNHKKYFSPSLTFSTLEINSTDTLSFLLRSIRLFRDLTRHRLSENNMAALVDLELNRIEYVYQKSTLPQKDSLTLAFYDHLLAQNLPRELKAEVLHRKANHYYRSSFTSGNDYMAETIALCRKIIDDYPDLPQAEWSRNMIKSLEIPELNVQAEFRELPLRPFRVLVEWKNIDTLRFSLYKINAHAAQKYMNQHWYEPGDFDSLLLVKKWNQKLPVVPGYQMRSVEIPVQGMPKGFYLLAASYQNESDSVSLNRALVVQVSSLSLTSRNKPGGILFVVNDAESGRPMSKVGLSIQTRQFDRQIREWKFSDDALLETNYAGEANFSEEDIRISRVLVFGKGDTLISESYIYSARGDSEQSEQPSVAFFTDRAIYRPGQLVQFKGLVSQKEGIDYKLVEKLPLTVVLRDVNYRQIETLEVLSNEYGTFSGSFVLPRSGLNGIYTIDCANGRNSFRVEAYRRPTFDVEFDEIGKSYAFGDSVWLGGWVKSYSGTPIANARVSYQVVASEAYNFPGMRPQNKQTIKTGLVYTEPDGSFYLPFKLQAGNALSPQQVMQYSVTAEATISAGETQNNTYEMRVSNSNLWIDCTLPDVINTNQFEGLELRTHNLNGDFVETDATLTIRRLEPPGLLFSERYWSAPDTSLLDSLTFKSMFPDFAFRNEDEPDSWVREEPVFDAKIAIAADTVLALSEWIGSKSGYYRVEIEAIEHDGKQTAKWHKTIRLIGERPANAEKLSDWVTVVKSKGEPGETAEIWLTAINPKAPVRYELVRDNELLESEVIVPGRRVYRLFIPIEQSYKGNVQAQFTQVANNREYHRYVTIEVPQNDKQLELTFQTFRNQLLPGENETWKLLLTDNSGHGVAAEMLASLYDASLDRFMKHSWKTRFADTRSNHQYRWNRNQNQRNAHFFSFLQVERTHGPVSSLRQYETPVLLGLNNWQNITRSGAGNEIMIRGVASAQKSMAVGIESDVFMMAEDAEFDMAQPVPEVSDNSVQSEKNDFSKVTLRENFNETAFFYPHLYSDNDGKLELSFTIPESITRWRMMGFAHTRDFKHGSIEAELVTRKNVSVEAYAPRFLRQGDTLFISATVRNLTSSKIEGNALLQFTDALTFEPITSSMLQSDSLLRFEVEAQSAELVRWEVFVPQSLQAVTYKVMARAGNHSDGEQKMLPVLTNRMLVTESMPFMVRGGDEKTFHFEKISRQNSSTLKNHSFTIEYTSNPVWYAIQSLPYLMEYPHECAEQVFSRFYANAAAMSLMQSSPRIKAIFDAWETTDADAFLSNLEKNSELKSVLLEESPWLVQAQNETEMKRRLSLLFDLNRMSAELVDAFLKLEQMQLPDGAFPWFAKMPGNRYITQYIVSGMSELQKMGAVPSGLNERWKQMKSRALQYLDEQALANYKQLLERSKKDSTLMEKYKPGMVELNHLYAHSFDVAGMPVDENGVAFDFLYKQAQKYWLEYDLYAQGILALTFHRFGQSEKAEAIVRSLADRALISESEGMYWANNKRGYRWHQSPVETQALLINVFDEVADDNQSVEEMKIWLLRSKQTNHWGNTKATVAACNALLNSGRNSLSESKALYVELAGKPLSQLRDIKAEAGTGYVKTSFSAGEITPELANVKVKNSNQGVAWGAAYWQYFEQLDKITTAATDVEITKQLFVKQKNDAGKILMPLNKQSINIGDEVVVRIVIETVRDMEYVHLKDLRAAGFEPTTTLSAFTWTDGLGYYRETKDAAMNFFIANLPKGVYVFEYSLRASHTGQFSTGITSLQCMYAPEFATHSEGQRITIE